MLNNTSTGAFFIDVNLETVEYENMLSNWLNIEIQRFTGAALGQKWFEQDGAGPHSAKLFGTYYIHNFLINGLVGQEKLSDKFVDSISRRFIIFCGLT